MKKAIMLLLVVLSSVFLFACHQSTTSTEEWANPTIPDIDYSSFNVDYFAIRSKDEFGRTISVNYYYTDLDQIIDIISQITTELPETHFNGGIGPLTGRYNDGWVEMTGSDDSSLLLNFYLLDDYTILGLKVENSPYEFYFNGLFDAEILSIFNSLST